MTIRSIDGEFTRRLELIIGKVTLALCQRNQKLALDLNAVLKEVIEYLIWYKNENINNRT